MCGLGGGLGVGLGVGLGLGWGWVLGGYRGYGHRGVTGGSRGIGRGGYGDGGWSFTSGVAILSLRNESHDSVSSVSGAEGRTGDAVGGAPRSVRQCRSAASKRAPMWSESAPRQCPRLL